MSHRAQWDSERRPPYHHMSHGWGGGGTCNTGVMLQELDLQLVLEVVCIFKLKDNMHVFCSAAARRVTRGSWGSLAGRWTWAPLTGLPRTAECILTSRTEVFKENCSGVEALMENTRRPSSSSLSSSFASTSPLTTPPPSTQLYST